MGIFGAARGWEAGATATLLKKRLWHRCFPVNFAKFLRTPLLKNTSWRLLLERFYGFEKIYSGDEHDRSKSIEKSEQKFR